MLADVVRRNGAAFGRLGWSEITVLSVAWFVGFARILSKVEEVGVWPESLLDAYIAVIPKADGDATWSTSVECPPDCLPYLGFSPGVMSVGGGRSSVEAWYTTVLDIEELDWCCWL